MKQTSTEIDSQAADKDDRLEESESLPKVDVVRIDFENGAITLKLTKDKKR